MCPNVRTSNKVVVENSGGKSGPLPASDAGGVNDRDPIMEAMISGIPLPRYQGIPTMYHRKFPSPQTDKIGLVPADVCSLLLHTQ